MHAEPATLEHVNALRGRLRASDYREIEAATGNSDVHSAVELSLISSSRAWAAMEGAQVLGVGGVSPVGHMAYVGSPWFVAAGELKQHAKPFLRLSRPYVYRMLSGYDLLTNWVDARNLASIRWLRWLGFIVEAPAPFGARQLHFCRFWRRKNV